MILSIMLRKGCWLFCISRELIQVLVTFPVKIFIYDFLSLCGVSECCLFHQFCDLLVTIRVSEKIMSERYLKVTVTVVVP